MLLCRYVLASTFAMHKFKDLLAAFQIWPFLGLEHVSLLFILPSYVQEVTDFCFMYSFDNISFTLFTVQRKHPPIFRREHCSSCG